MATDLTATGAMKSPADFQGILRDEELNFQSSDSSAGAGLNSWFARLVVQSGSTMLPSMVLTVCMMCGIFLAGMVMLFLDNLLAASMALGSGFLIPLFSLSFMRKRRQKKIMNQMPETIDELARAAKTGRSPEECFKLVAGDTPEPLGVELRNCARRLEMGMGLGEALQQLPLRTGLVSLNVLATALDVHQRMGGDLVRLLERLAKTMRDRLSYFARLRAMTTASRATAVLMIALPPCVLAFFIIRDPEYLNTLMSSRWGRGAMYAALVFEVVGSLWVLRILKQTERA